MIRGQKPFVQSDDYGSLTLSGYLQAQVRYGEDSGPGIVAIGAPAADGRFEIRRGRFRLDYERDIVFGMLQIDGTAQRVAMLDAYVGVKLGSQDDFEAKLIAGLFNIPFGFDVSFSSKERLLLERSLLARRFFPRERDLGVQLSGTIARNLVNFRLALQNGHPLGDAVSPGSDPNSAKDIVGRVGFMTGTFQAGASALLGRGFLPGVIDDPMTMNVDETRDAKQFPRWAMGLDSRFVHRIPGLGTLDVYGEVAFARNLDRSALGDYPEAIRVPSGAPEGGFVTTIQSRDAWGWYAVVAQQLGSLFAAALRLEQFDPNVKTRDDTLTFLDAAVILIPSDAFRVTASWEFRWAPSPYDHDQGWLRAQLSF